MSTTPAKKTSKTSKTPPTLSIGLLIDNLAAIRDERRVLKARDKELVADYDTAEALLITLLETQDQRLGSNNNYTASISINTCFSPFTADTDGEDGWPKFMAYIARLKRWDLVQRRVSDPGVRELCELKGVIPPGLKSREVKTINLRVLQK